jgi:hypothetical protein
MSSINNNANVNVVSEFNASISVTELLTKTLENMAKELAIRCITECASMYRFDAVDAIVALGLQNISLTRKPMHKSVEKSIVTKAPKPIKEIKSTFPFPFVPSRVNETSCKGLSYNHGLFTQCAKSCMSTGSFCKSCQTEADNSATGCPDCGTVAQRIDTDLYEFKDSKGRSPIRYTKFLEKSKLTAEQAVEEAGKLNFTINECHFTSTDKQKKEKKEDAVARGRPKKISINIVAEQFEDLFEKLTTDSVEESEEEEEEEEKVVIPAVAVVAPKPKPTVAKTVVMSDEDKALKKAAFEAEREARREAKRLENKQKKNDEIEIEKKLAEANKLAVEIDKEAKKLAEKEEKEANEAKKLAEKEAKKLAEKEEKEANKLAEKEEKEAKKLAEKEEKEAKKLVEKEEKEAKKIALEAKKQALEAKKIALEAKKESNTKKQPPPVIEQPVIEEKSNAVGVRPFEINGIKYFKSDENVLYTAEGEEFGVWNKITKQIEPLPANDSDSEEEEEEYEDEDVKAEDKEEDEDEDDEEEDA